MKDVKPKNRITCPSRISADSTILDASTGSLKNSLQCKI